MKGFTAHSLSFTPFHQLNIYEILLKGLKSFWITAMCTTSDTIKDLDRPKFWGFSLFPRKSKQGTEELV